MDNKQRKINPVFVVIGMVGAVILILLGVTLAQLLRQNPFGPQIRIDNFGQYFDGVPQGTQDSLYAALFDIVERNSAEGAEISENGALVRDGSTSYTYSQAENMHFGTFIVDVPEVGQSYNAYFEWSDNSNNPYYSGYETLYTCLDEKDLIYGDFGCSDMFSGTVTVLFPITRELPLKIEYYENNYTMYTKYFITYNVVGDNEGIELVVDDYTGGNYEKALAKISELGYNPEKYIIKYNDKSSNDAWPYVGD